MKCISIPCAALVLVCSGAEARGPAMPSSIPFELYKGHILVSAYVNGAGPFRFGFDTGASGDGRADKQLTVALSLPAVGQRETTDGIKTANVDAVSVKSIRLGPVEKHNVEFLSRDYNGGKHDEHSIMGIIGRDFVAAWLVTINYPKRTITFRRTHLRFGDQGVVRYEPSFAVPVCFAAGCFTGKIDTGSSRSIVVPKDLALKLSAGVAVKVGQVMRTNSSATLYEMSLREPVRIAGMSIRNQKVLYVDPSDTAINVGSAFLEDYVLSIDQRRRLLSIRRQ